MHSDGLGFSEFGAVEVRIILGFPGRARSWSRSAMGPPVVPARRVTRPWVISTAAFHVHTFQVRVGATVKDPLYFVVRNNPMAYAHVESVETITSNF